MNIHSKIPFKARIEIIGVNPFVFLPERVLSRLFKQAGKDKGKIPVRMTVDGHEFIQTLIKYSGHWRLYLNTPMRKATEKEVGDVANFEIEFDPLKRTVAPHPKLLSALRRNKAAKEVFDNLRPSRQLEIIRYLSSLKTAESVDRNVARVVNFLLGKARFVGRDNV